MPRAMRESSGPARACFGMGHLSAADGPDLGWGSRGKWAKATGRGIEENR
jgi:hypothetical protein